MLSSRKVGSVIHPRDTASKMNCASVKGGIFQSLQMRQLRFSLRQYIQEIDVASSATCVMFEARKGSAPESARPWGGFSGYGTEGLHAFLVRPWLLRAVLPIAFDSPSPTLF